MEADLQRFYGLDVRDRWHPDPTRRLTLRRLVVLVWRFPPAEGAVVAVSTGRAHWSMEAHLLDDLRRTVEAVNGVKSPKPHPLRDTSRSTKRLTPERAKRLRAARQRARARRTAIERGEIT